MYRNSIYQLFSQLWSPHFATERQKKTTKFVNMMPWSPNHRNHQPRNCDEGNQSLGTCNSCQFGADTNLGYKTSKVEGNWSPKRSTLQTWIYDIWMWISKYEIWRILIDQMVTYNKMDSCFFASPIERSLSLAHFTTPPPIDANNSAPLSMHQRTSAPCSNAGYKMEGVTNWTRVVTANLVQLLTKLRLRQI